MSKGLTKLLNIKTTGLESGQKTLDNSVLYSLKERLEDPSGFDSYIRIKSLYLYDDRKEKNTPNWKEIFNWQEKFVCKNN